MVAHYCSLIFCRFKMSWLLDYVPVIGTVKNTLKCVSAFVHDDTGRAVEKLTSAVVGGTLDVVTFAVELPLFKLGVKEMVVCNVAGRVACGSV